MKIQSHFVRRPLIFRILSVMMGVFLGSVFSLIFFIILQIGANSIGGNWVIISPFLFFGTSFIAIVSSNVLAVFLLAREEMRNMNSFSRNLLFQVFYGNICIMILGSPFFLFMSDLHTEVLFFFPFSALASFAVYEALIPRNISSFEVYKFLLEIFILFYMLFFFFSPFVPERFMLFFLLPFSWGVLLLSSAFFEKIRTLSFFR